MNAVLRPKCCSSFIRCAFCSQDSAEIDFVCTIKIINGVYACATCGWCFPSIRFFLLVDPYQRWNLFLDVFDLFHRRYLRMVGTHRNRYNHSWIKKIFWNKQEKSSIFCLRVKNFPHDPHQWVQKSVNLFDLHLPSGLRFRWNCSSGWAKVRSEDTERMLLKTTSCFGIIFCVKLYFFFFWSHRILMDLR